MTDYFHDTIELIRSKPSDEILQAIINSESRKMSVLRMYDPDEVEARKLVNRERALKFKRSKAA